MIWVFYRLVETYALTKKEAIKKLKQLTTTNFVFQNNKQLIAKIEKR